MVESLNNKWFSTSEKEDFISTYEYCEANKPVNFNANLFFFFYKNQNF